MRIASLQFKIEKDFVHYTGQVLYLIYFYSINPIEEQTEGLMFDDFDKMNIQVVKELRD